MGSLLLWRFVFEKFSVSPKNKLNTDILFLFIRTDCVQWQLAEQLTPHKSLVRIIFKHFLIRDRYELINETIILITGPARRWLGDQCAS